VQDWLNRIGLTLQFLALFLVTPEIVGAKRLEDADKKLANVLRWIAPRWWTGIGVGLLVIQVAILIFTPRSDWWLPGAFSIVTALVFAWLGPGKGGKLILRLAERMAKSDRTYLPVGAFIFTIGFVLLMCATFVPADK
jgi:hypothetical protein